MHTAGVVHRDIKLENLIFKNAADLNSVKLLDLGFAIRVDPLARTFGSVSGTPAYMAPEICNVLLGAPAARERASFSFSVDIWAAGVSLYLLLGGYPPFEGDTMQQVFSKVSTADVRFDGRVWGSVSTAAKLLIRRLLSKHPQNRPTAAQAMKDPWLMEQPSAAALTAAAAATQRSESFENIRRYIR